MFSHVIYCINKLRNIPILHGRSHSSYCCWWHFCSLLIHHHALYHENKITESANIKKFFTYSNKKFCNKSPVGLLKGFDSRILIDSVSKAELLNKVVSDCFTCDNNIYPQLPRAVGNNLCNIISTPAFLRKSIELMEAKYKGSLDGIPLFRRYFSRNFLYGYVSPQNW